MHAVTTWLVCGLAAAVLGLVAERFLFGRIDRNHWVLWALAGLMGGPLILVVVVMITALLVSARRDD